jgi:hypothetical protein
VTPSFAYTLARRHETGAYEGRDEVRALREELRKAQERVAWLESLLGMEPGENVVPLRKVK